MVRVERTTASGARGCEGALSPWESAMPASYGTYRRTAQKEKGGALLRLLLSNTSPCRLILPSLLGLADCERTSRPLPSGRGPTISECARALPRSILVRRGFRAGG